MTPAQFAAADPRRRHSPAVLLGADWYDSGRAGRHSLHWFPATGELVLVGHPDPDETYGAAGPGRPLAGLAVHGVRRFARSLRRGAGTAGTIRVLGRFATLTEVGQVLAGWEEAARRQDGVGWLRDRVARAGGGA